MIRSFALPRIFTSSGLAAHTLESIKPALRALVADSVARVPDYVPIEQARLQVRDALMHSVDHALAHVPALHLTRGLLLVCARQIIDRADFDETVAGLKAFAVDQMIVRINGAQA